MRLYSIKLRGGSYLDDKENQSYTAFHDFTVSHISITYKPVLL